MMKFYVFSFLVFSFMVQAESDVLVSKASPQTNTEQVKSQKKKKEVKPSLEEEDEDRSTATQKNSLEDFSTAQTGSLQVAQLTNNSPSGFTHYLAGNAVEVGVEYPINFGLHVKTRINGDFYTRVGFGFVTEFFLGSFSKLAPNLGYLNQQEADLISDVLKNSLYGEVRVGWSPYYEKHAGGPYIELGVSGMFLGKGETSGFTLSKAIEVGDESQSHYSVKSNTYNTNLHIGYQIPIEKHIHMHIEIGVLKIFRADSVSQETPGVKVLPEESQGELENFLIDKGWIFPTGSVWFGFAF